MSNFFKKTMEFIGLSDEEERLDVEPIKEEKEPKKRKFTKEELLTKRVEFKEKRIEAREKLKELQKEKNAKYIQSEDPSQKEIDKKKLAAARKRMAEKYGDTYEEVKDEDLK